MFFSITASGYVYETFGISKRFPVKLQVPLKRAETFNISLTAKRFIYDVTAWCSLFSVIFLSICYMVSVCLLCAGRGKLFGWFCSCVGFSERPDNVLGYKALAVDKLNILSNMFLSFLQPIF
jgi:hypothetical protein